MKRGPRPVTLGQTYPDLTALHVAVRIDSAAGPSGNAAESVPLDGPLAEGLLRALVHQAQTRAIGLDAEEHVSVTVRAGALVRSASLVLAGRSPTQEVLVELVERAVASIRRALP